MDRSVSSARFACLWRALSPAALVLGLCGLATAQTGPFRVEADDHGVWAFVDASGQRFVSIGISNVSAVPYMPREGTTYYRAAEVEFGGDIPAWGASVAKRLGDAGFNTIGAWSEPRIPVGSGMLRTPVLYVSAFAPDRTLEGLRPGFEARARKIVRDQIALYEGGSRSWLGVFLDNEAPWWGRSAWDNIPTYTLLDRALELPVTDPAHAAAVAFLKERYASCDRLAAAWERPLASWKDLTYLYSREALTDASQSDRSAFLTLAAERWFAGATSAVRAEAPGVLILGTRFAGSAPREVIAACGKYCDVISFNKYPVDPALDTGIAALMWDAGAESGPRRPLMVTEFSWRARENQSGNTNKRGAGAVLQTQAERADHYKAFFADAMSFPGVIGLHWFEFFDESPQGRFDGEDGNYGVVDIYNKPYEELLAAMTESHARVGELRAHADRPFPSNISGLTVAYLPGQHPGRPSTLELLPIDPAHPATKPPGVWSAPDAHINQRLEDGRIIGEYDCGDRYGAGINFHGPASLALGRGRPESTDLDGYEVIVVEAKLPKGLQMNVNVYEAGSDESGRSSYDRSAGDDGEAWQSIPVYGTGDFETYRLRISRLVMPMFMGNQGGGKRIDMQAVRNIGVQVQGTPRTGEIELRSLRLEK